MDRSAGPGVKAQRLHNGERGGSGEDLDVRGGEHAGVPGDDGCGSPFSDLVEVAFHEGPEVPRRAVFHVIPRRVDTGQRLFRVGFDVGDVLLVNRDVLACGEELQAGVLRV